MIRGNIYSNIGMCLCKCNECICREICISSDEGNEDTRRAFLFDGYMSHIVIFSGQITPA